MIPRYTLPEIGQYWTPEAKFQKWMDVELEVLKWRALAGDIAQEDFDYIRDNASFNVERIAEIEAETRHDVIAFVTCVTEKLDDRGRFFHHGLTSSDVVDTSFALQIRDSFRKVRDKLDVFAYKIERLAVKHKRTYMMGRTHTVHAEPTTLGLKLAIWHQELRRTQERLLLAYEQIKVGKLSGAVGNYSTFSPSFEEKVLMSLGLDADPVSSQIVQRDRHAFVLTSLALLGSTLDKFATEIRHLSRTEVRELEEPFGAGQKGSSAMPHKRNPIKCERVSGLARVLRANAVVGLENVALWHERDISHSSAERVVFPDSMAASYYMLDLMCKIVDGLKVYPNRMMSNMNATNGLGFSSRVLKTLIASGMRRDDAYAVVQSSAMTVWDSLETGGVPVSFIDTLVQNETVMQHVSAQELVAAFDVESYFENIDEVFERLGLS